MNLDELFESAKEHYCRHFGMSWEEFTKQWGLKSEFRYGVLRYMDFQLRLFEAEGWAKKLQFDREKLEAERRR